MKKIKNISKDFRFYLRTYDKEQYSLYFRPISGILKQIFPVRCHIGTHGIYQTRENRTDIHVRYIIARNKTKSIFFKIDHDSLYIDGLYIIK